MAFLRLAFDTVPDLTHPTYLANREEWMKWRLAYAGGEHFKDNYLRKYDARESTVNFNDRRCRTYNPPVTRTEIGKLKNNLVQHLSFVKRTGGPTSYQKAICGQAGGVDLTGRSMHDFFAEEIVPELILMSKVGIFVDMPIEVGPTKAHNVGIRPYVYAYTCEQILSWTEDPTAPGNFLSLLLQDKKVDYDDSMLLPKRDIVTLYRHFQINANGFIDYKIFSDAALTDQQGVTQEIRLRNIPFVVIQLPVAVMRDVADMQIALLNLASADINYCYQSNFVLLTEEIDVRRGSPFVGGEDDGDGDDDGDGRPAGPTYSLQYAKGCNPPDFISPPAEPTKLSMEKQAAIAKAIGDAIRETISELDAAGVSQNLTGSLPGGLACIGSMLQRAERQIADIWAKYEGVTTLPSIIYPLTFSIQSDQERSETAKTLKNMLDCVPSIECKREIAKLISSTLLAGRVDPEKLNKIYAEIDAAKCFPISAADVEIDRKNGLVSAEFASQWARGYPAGEAAKAKGEHLEEVAAIAAAQTKGVGPHVVHDTNNLSPVDAAAARGLPTYTGSGAPEKDGKPVRGDGMPKPT